ncbi:ABC transporter permease [Clostridium estertheticum]|uniref:ABC transporter permease n=1 Tax=Clostridium estertheticum TaxID=238834 RepID=UPI001C6F4F72|nr:ABC transporter permease [Clostridium estertheticum]MBW9153856.1 ABC transporter permease [Clostridium estertheticum]WLC86474.1 ABC transporter permease [Clostridium estertheticum]
MNFMRLNCKPLSWSKYVTKNKKKTLVIMLTIILGVFLLVITKMIIFSIQTNVYSAWAKPFENLSAIVPIQKNFNLNSKYNIHATYNMHDTYIDKIFITGATGRISTYSFFIKNGDLAFICNKINVKLIKGSFPKAGTNQVVIHKSIATNKGLHIGDYIGKEKDNRESLLGSYLIVGIVDSDAVISIGDYNYYKEKNPIANSGYIFDKKLYQFNADKDGTSYNMYTYEKESNDIKKYGSILILSMNILSIFIYTIVGFFMICMIYVFYNQRKREFGILMAIGYSSDFLIIRCLKEISSMVLSGGLLGIFVGLFTGEILNITIFKSWGQILTVFNMNYLLEPLILMILLILTSLIIVSSIVKKVDCISLIEGES